MRIFDPHIHMTSRTTDDYEAMAAAGVAAHAGVPVHHERRAAGPRLRARHPRTVARHRGDAAVLLCSDAARGRERIAATEVKQLLLDLAGVG